MLFASARIVVVWKVRKLFHGESASCWQSGLELVAWSPSGHHHYESVTALLKMKFSCLRNGIEHTSKDVGDPDKSND